jgi:hypothetical protein
MYEATLVCSKFVWKSWVQSIVWAEKEKKARKLRVRQFFNLLHFIIQVKVFSEIWLRSVNLLYCGIQNKLVYFFFFLFFLFLAVLGIESWALCILASTLAWSYIPSWLQLTSGVVHITTRRKYNSFVAAL